MANGIRTGAVDSIKVPEFDKHLKKAGGYISQNFVEKTIKMKTIVQKPLMIKIRLTYFCFQSKPKFLIRWSILTIKKLSNSANVRTQNIQNFEDFISFWFLDFSLSQEISLFPKSSSPNLKHRLFLWMLLYSFKPGLLKVVHTDSPEVVRVNKSIDKFPPCEPLWHHRGHIRQWT